MAAMKLIDYIIAALIVGCMFVGYSGHRLIAILLLALVAILASWRFWDRRREKEMARTGSSGELNPEHDNWADVSSGYDSSAGDSGGGDE
jgi:membrane protein implicated in regulation of membrane protease activity